MIINIVTNEKITIVKILFADSFIILNPAFKIKNATTVSWDGNNVHTNDKKL